MAKRLICKLIGHKVAPYKEHGQSLPSWCCVCKRCGWESPYVRAIKLAITLSGVTDVMTGEVSHDKKNRE
jgi:hypothetical protein